MDGRVELIDERMELMGVRTNARVTRGLESRFCSILDDRSGVVRFYRLLAPLRDVLLVLACSVLWAERFTCRHRLEIDIRRRPRNPRMGLSQYFPSVLMCSETTVISVCQKRVPKVYQEAFVTIETSLRRPTCFRVPFICSWIGRPGSPVRKASANVRECAGLSRRLLKCARRLPVVLPIGADEPKWGADSLPLFGCVLG
ncbi:hypothetical protein CRG98_017991 [Punica granatum]|uniref:Uncharacterized protein n=1 Tax=Punica granatum TaxID=22663 RepID=A0A2I0K1N7_PUNGR|nr:hypothetical protein CRG98_017991 [Punica granatum]